MGRPFVQIEKSEEKDLSDVLEPLGRVGLNPFEELQQRIKRTGVLSDLQPSASSLHAIAASAATPAAPAASTIVLVVATPVPAVSTLLTVMSPVVPAPPAPIVAPRVPFCPVSALGAVSSTCTVTTSAAVCVGLKRFCVATSLNIVSALPCLIFELGLIFQRALHSTSDNLSASPPFWACFNLEKLESPIRQLCNFGILIYSSMLDNVDASIPA